ncbi:hypothetical protein ACG2LH_01355 [Zhouia sp. PK063]|uniref:hypothetical protein n=1 Tax=Zhouia sp. PK063 TaxID=3373602 RepID=UPI00379C7D2C
MKKLVLAAVIALGSLSTYATTTVQSTTTNIVAVQQDEFKEIKADEVPQAVKDALEKDFPGAQIDKAYVNESKQYKIEVSASGASTTLYANEKGEWIKKPAE